MGNYSECPNCYRDHNNLKIYKCNRCGQKFCKKCNRGSTIVHHDCIGTGKMGTVEVGIVNETSSSTYTSDYSTQEKSGCWSTLWKIIKWIFIILVVIIVLALIFGD
ncbi:MAG: hypothetical protein GQ564_03770 [Bacteroidales bacterium]|nr:hypothetical protein [Bacteroidales bacterium]